MFTHVMIGSNDLDLARRFYDATFLALGGEPGQLDAGGRVVYGHNGSRLMITKLVDGNPATAANGGTIGILATSAQRVSDWHAAGIANGGMSAETPPSERPSGAFVAYLRDPDGNKLCARTAASR